MANTLWSYATLGHDPGAPLLDAIAAHICDRMHVFRPQASSNSLWVCSRLLLRSLQLPHTPYSNLSCPKAAQFSAALGSRPTARVTGVMRHGAALSDVVPTWHAARWQE